MFDREEVSRTRHEFWIAFGRYMSPILSSEGMKVSWLNYPTGIKDIYFRMNAGLTSAVIAISIEQNDSGIRELYFDQFLELKNLLHDELGEEWTWEMNVTIDGRSVSRIFKDLTEVSVMDRNQWSDLISFFKPRIIALDRFWENGKYSFEVLR